MATNAVARGQISFIDLNDGKSLSLYLASNRPLTQLHYIDGLVGYSPDYTTEPLIITPTLYISGSTTNQIGQIKDTPHWVINGVDVNTEANPDTLITANFPSGVAFDTDTEDAEHPYALRITSNTVVNTPQMTIFCSAIYWDRDTQTEMRVSTSITVTKMDVAPGTIVAYIMADGTFLNGESDERKLHCVVQRGVKKGNAIAGDDDGGQFSFEWFRQDDPGGADAFEWHKIVTAYSGPGGTPATGEIEDTGDNWEEILPFGIRGAGTDTIIVPASTITNYDHFMCLVTDIEQGSGTIGHQVATTAVSLHDISDPYSIDFKSPAGTVMTSGTSFLETKASVWCRGHELDDNKQNGFNYLWTKSDKDGEVATGDTSVPTMYKHADASGTPDANWMVQNPFGESTSVYCRYAQGSQVGESARKLKVWKNEVEAKSTFFLEIYLP